MSRSVIIVALAILAGLAFAPGLGDRIYHDLAQASVASANEIEAIPDDVSPPQATKLRVYSDPAVATTIYVDGQPRNDWGLDWLELSSGSYNLTFHEVTGYFAPTTLNVRHCGSGGCSSFADQPASQAVEVRDGETTEVRASFRPAAYLRVTTEGYGNSSPTISIDGNPANQWGLWVALPAGSRNVSFQSVGGSTITPCSRQVTLTDGQTVHVHGNYTTGTCDVQ